MVFAVESIIISVMVSIVFSSGQDDANFQVVLQKLVQLSGFLLKLLNFTCKKSPNNVKYDHAFILVAMHKS